MKILQVMFLIGMIVSVCVQDIYAVNACGFLLIFFKLREFKS